MNKMKTLTVNGETFAVWDPEAARIDNSLAGEQAWSGKAIADRLCPPFSGTGAPVTCRPVEGYPLSVQTQAGATKILRSGKNLLKLTGREVITTTNSEPLTAPNGNKLYIGALGTGQIYSKTISSYSVTDSEISFYSSMAGYGLGFDVCVLPNTRYMLSTEMGESERLWVMYYTPEGVYIDAERGAAGIASLKFTTPENARYAVILFRGNKNKEELYFANPQLEFGGAATPYEAPNVGEFVPGEAIPALAGDNRLWADAGEITVTGRADPVAILQSLMGGAQNVSDSH